VANDALEQSLRAEIDKHFNARLDELRSEITRIQNLLNEAVAQHQTDTERAVAKLTEGISADHDTVVAAVAEQLRSDIAAQESATQSSNTNDSASVSVIRNAIVDLNKQKSQADILKTLVGYTASLAPRVAFFIVKEGHTKGWRARGFDGTVGNDAISSIALPLTEQTLLSETVKTQETWDGEPGQYQHDYKLLGGLGAVTPKRMAAIPLIARGKSVAVLYADSGQSDAELVDIEALESLVKVAGLNVELTVAPKSSAAVAPTVAPTAPTPQPVPEPVSQPEAVKEVAQPEQPVETVSGKESFVTTPAFEPEVSYTPPPLPPPPSPSHDKSFDLSGYTTNPTITAPVETYTPVETYAPVEPPPIERPTYSPATPQQPAPPISASSTAATRSYGRKDIELPIEVSDEERRYHNEARRFARLLVSEIKLYNEPKVKEGRESHDLYDRLREAIDRSREMYDKRVASQVASRFDYFNYELINTLAEGDEGKLGNDYPGSSV